MQKDRRETNPAFGNRKLKFGTFQTNLDSGCVMSDIDGRLEISWPNTIALAKLADEMEFETIVPVARWRGFGGAVNPQGEGFECYTWAAGVAASTTKAGVMSTSHVVVQPSDHRRQAGRGDRSHFQRPLHAQHRVRLERAGNGDVRHGPGAARRPLCPRRGMARRSSSGYGREDGDFDHDGQFYQIKKGYAGAEADPGAPTPRS